MIRKSYKKYKDSGIKWLGKIPGHWEVTRFKYGINLIESGKRDLVEHSDILSIGGEHVGADHKLHFKNLKYISEEFYNNNKKGRVQKRDILIVKDGATIGKTAYVDENQLNQKMLLNEHVYRVVAHKYIYYFVLSSFFQSKIWAENNSTAQEGLNLSTIKNIPLLKPSKEEQKVIANFLDKETARIDTLIDKIQKSIELLREYRSVLITQAVTGKIDVCSVQAKKLIPFQKPKSLKTTQTIMPSLVAKTDINKVAFKPIKTKKSGFVAKKTSGKKAPSLFFKKAVLGAEIVSQMQKDPHFGRTKFMKIFYLCETHLQIPLKGEYKREAAGPLDSSIYTIESIMTKQEWFRVIQGSGKKNSILKYKPLKNSEGYKGYFHKYWGDYKGELNKLLLFAKQWNTEQSEIIGTIYAVWNDFLIEGKNSSDNKIIDGVKNNWHKSKKRFPDHRLKTAIKWMKKQNLIPKGYGQKTIKEQT